MRMGLPGWCGRQLRSLAYQMLAGAAAVALAAPLAGPADAATKKPVAAIPVPIPRASPQRTAPAAATPAPAATAATPSKDDNSDAIADLISGDDASEAATSEDSDLPEVVSPDIRQSPPPVPSGPPIDPVGLKLALNLLDNNDPGGAMLAAYALPNRTDIKIVQWLVATGGYDSVTSSTIADIRSKLTDWPGQAAMRLRYEQALVREKPSSADVIKALGNGIPISDDGKVLLASAYLDAGRKADAAAIIRPFWRDEDCSIATEQTVLSRFSDLIKPADDKSRMDRLLYAENATAALRVAARLDKSEVALAKAAVLAIKGSSKAANKAFDALPAGVRKDALYTYFRVQLLRRADKIEDAARLLAAAPRDPAVIEDPDAWWVERRLVSRALIEKGDAKLAYTIAANHSQESPPLRAEAEFHAGWYALEYLHDPAKAQGHFAAIAAMSSMPLSLSRAEYWLGRTADAANDAAGARLHFQKAAGYPTTFYGQLAVSRLGGQRLDIPPAPDPSSQARINFASRELVQVIRHLTAADYADRAKIFYRHLAETLSDPGEIVLLARMAEESGDHPLALQIGKTAAARGLPVDALAFPTAAIPATAKTPSVERPVVFAIARQESAFNADAVSRAGARGLLQLMPSTAKETAKTIGLPYSKARLTSDPGYNATLGAAHLGTLVDNFGGSYVMTFAAYNAGAGRVAQWVKAHGDPRDPDCDVVNWIELIPFTETRNYVQRIMENLQVYRARFGAPTLTIEADLHRGGPDAEASAGR